MHTFCNQRRNLTPRVHWSRVSSLFACQSRRHSPTLSFLLGAFEPGGARASVTASRFIISHEPPHPRSLPRLPRLQLPHSSWCLRWPGTPSLGKYCILWMRPSHSYRQGASWAGRLLVGAFRLPSMGYDSSSSGRQRNTARSLKAASYTQSKVRMYPL